MDAKVSGPFLLHSHNIVYSLDDCSIFFCQTMIKNLNSLDISTELLYHLQQSNCLFRVQIMVKWIVSYGTRGRTNV